MLNKEIQDFIDENLNTDTSKILLNPPKFEDIDIKDLVLQIEAKQKSEGKLPTWFATNKIYYPQPISIEQSSSETTAEYKASLIKGNELLDVTMGFGVDAYYYSKVFSKVTGCEMNTELSKITEYNAQILNIHNLKIRNTDGIKYLEQSNKNFDCIYVDPSRRDKTNNRVFRFKACLPNVVQHLDLLLNRSKTLLIKSSPLIDLKLGSEELKNLADIHVVAVKNEVKELLWIIKSGYEETIRITAINLGSNEKPFKFDFDDESKAESTFSLPQKYLYEPNASILKSGAFKLISEKFNLNKLHQHTHLYTNNKLIEFSGRRFKITEVLPFTKKLLKRTLPNKANVSTRNFPITVKEIRKTFKISDGGDDYLFFTTDLNDKKVVVVCLKV